MGFVNLADWIETHPSIAISIFWEDVGGEYSYLFWPTHWKDELQHAFDLARQGSSIPVQDVPPNTLPLADQEFPTTILNHDDAWAYFKASVAQSLAAEVDGLFPWSLTTYSEAQLAELFNSREMFFFNPVSLGYRIDNTHGWVVPAPPAFSLKFLSSNGMLAATALDTVANLLGWCTPNLLHFGGAITVANMEDRWQYRGLPPMFRVIEGTVQTSEAGAGKKHFTAGCWGTTGLLRAALRAVNIPVKLVHPTTHAQPWFMTLDRYLSHGDDPYNLDVSSALPPLASTELFISQAAFDDWFGPNVAPADRLNNIGRRCLQLAIKFLPLTLLWDYCGDKAAGKSHADGQVLADFTPVYTLAQLEGADLWTRMDAKIASYGGCGTGLPPLYPSGG